MVENRNRILGLALALIAVLTASVAPVLVKVGVNENIHPITLLMLRLWIASAFFWVYFSITKPAVLRITHRQFIYSSIAGAVNCTGLILYYLAIQRLDVSVATMIFSFYPIFTVLLLALKGERIHLNALICIIVSLLGVYLLLQIGGGLNILGILLILGTTFGYALHLNIVQWYLSDYSAQTTAIYTITTMAVICTLVWLLGPRSFTPISFAGWISILGTAVISTALTRLALFSAIRRIGSGQTSYFGPLEILLGIFWAVVFLGEYLNPRQWFGGFLILASMIWLMLYKGNISKQIT
ncbi:hypothetical protein A2W24_01105 [Microgenomates group bacterium RBG_16_45_19]|nr:MAG: hypothetical protein A2W24_01105 [Microgenomates group bacterium RBG_16_45_19]